MTRARERAIKMYWEMAKEKCPFRTEELVNGYLEGFIDCAELFEEEDKLTLTKYARIIIDKKDECIEELEKENTALRQEWDVMKNTITDCNTFCDKLKKENAELKEINEGYCRSRDRLISIGFPTFKDCKEYAEQLTKAREIISEYIKIVKGDTKTWMKTQEKAEQFLKEYK